MDKFIVLLLTIPLLAGASMCDSKPKPKASGSATSTNAKAKPGQGIADHLMKPVKEVPKGYKDALKGRQNRMDKSLEKALGESK